MCNKAVDVEGVWLAAHVAFSYARVVPIVQRSVPSHEIERSSSPVLPMGSKVSDNLSPLECRGRRTKRAHDRRHRLPFRPFHDWRTTRVLCGVQVRDLETDFCRDSRHAFEVVSRYAGTQGGVGQFVLTRPVNDLAVALETVEQFLYAADLKNSCHGKTVVLGEGLDAEILFHEAQARES